MNTVLVIDDDKDYRESLVEILHLESFKTLEAENGLLGLEMIQLHIPSMIVCDVNMPVMNGLELLKAVKSDPIAAKIPFLIITGQNNVQSLNIARDLNIEAYLRKPVDVAEFLATVVHLLNVNPSFDTNTGRNFVL